MSANYNVSNYSVADYDVIVVGSGFGGSIVASRLAQAGARVALLERGQRRSSRELRQSDDPAYLQEVIDFVFSSQNIGYRTGKLVGGASINMDGQFYRVPTKSFDAHDDKGRRYWPDAFSRAALDPYYRRVETALSIRQRSWDEVPKAGGLFAKMIANAGARCDPSPMNFTDCRQCGFCAAGCIFNHKRTMLHTYLATGEALAHNPLEVHAETSVSTVEKRGARYIAHTVRNGVAAELSADRMVVAAGGIHSAALLLRSAGSLGSPLSTALGAHFNTNGEHTYIGVLPEGFEGSDDYYCYMGMENGGVMSFEWFESDGLTLHSGSGMEASILAASFADPARQPALPSSYFGLEAKRFAESIYPRRIISIATLGLAPSHQAVVLGPGGEVDVVARDRTAYDQYLDRVDGVLKAVSAKSDITLIEAYRRRWAGMTGTHLLSACRMAETIEDGVVDDHCRLFGHDNLYVVDASVIPYALAVNPAHTISAIAERTADLMLGVAP